MLAAATARAESPVTTIAPDSTVALVASAPEIASPKLASRGFDTFAVWSQTDASGRQRVHLAHLRDGRLQPRLVEDSAAPIDGSRTGDNLYPDLALGPDNAAGVIWVNAAADRNLLLYSDGTHPPIAIASTTNTIGTPVLAYDERAATYAAWTETVGGKSLILAAVKAPQGDWVSGPLSFGERPYDLFPQIFPAGRSADLYCYGQNNDRYIGRRVTLRANAVPTENPLPDDIPAARLPLLYRNSAKHIGAIWLEQTDFGELHFDLNPSLSGERQLQELTASTGAISQVAVAHDDSGAKVWTESGASEASTITVVGGDGLPRHFDSPGGASSPAVSASANFLHVLWVSDHPNDGTNGLNYRRIPK